MTKDELIKELKGVKETIAAQTPATRKMLTGSNGFKIGKRHDKWILFCIFTTTLLILSVKTTSRNLAFQRSKCTLLPNLCNKKLYEQPKSVGPM